MSDLRAYLIAHPALVYWLSFARVPDPTAPHGFAVAASVPTRRQLGTVLHTLPNPALQFLLTSFKTGRYGAEDKNDNQRGHSLRVSNPFKTGRYGAV